MGACTPGQAWNDLGRIEVSVRRNEERTGGTQLGVVEERRRRLEDDQEVLSLEPASESVGSAQCGICAGGRRRLRTVQVTETEGCLGGGSTLTNERTDCERRSGAVRGLWADESAVGAEPDARDERVANGVATLW
ncbi:unnamed protein product [Phytophthora fragariaefolia]|uniref:Unnamed protein product n=1 Tax=Phytophthora fragariaefolia TaxID=1490495 RepID=A0A9W6WWM0_9STRA|nr:unnamed protein product [Phytophthora fragariaefolia]